MKSFLFLEFGPTSISVKEAEHSSNDYTLERRMKNSTKVVEEVYLSDAYDFKASAIMAELQTKYKLYIPYKKHFKEQYPDAVGDYALSPIFYLNRSAFGYRNTTCYLEYQNPEAECTGKITRNAVNGTHFFTVVHRGPTHHKAWKFNTEKEARDSLIEFLEKRSLRDLL